MTPLAPAVFELRLAGASLAACGLAWLVAADPAGGGAAQAAAGGLAVSMLLLWVLLGARVSRRAARLALPVRTSWRLEPTGTTVARVLGARTAPAVALAAVAAVLAEPRVPDAAAAAAAALAGAGLSALLAAARLRRAETTRGRRLLHRASLLRPLDRNSLFLEPTSLDARPGEPRPPAPWPAHRPPARAPRALVEIEPANGAAVHGAGVRPRPAARVRPPAPPGPGGPAAGG